MNTKNKKELVEHQYRLNIDDLDCSLFLESDSNRGGKVRLTACQEELNVDYEVCGDTLYIQFNGSEQGIDVVRIPALKGYKRYFMCDCRKRCKILYLKADSNKERFGCRICKNLTYLCNRATRDTVNGAIFSDFNRLTRLIERREKIRSPWYRGEPTKKFQKLLSDSEKYGFHIFEQEQRNGIKDLADMKRVVEIAKNG